MTPIADEIARAEALHGPLPLHIEPSHTLINAAAYMEYMARTEDPMSALAILCEEVGEVARAAPEDLPAELAQVIAVAVRWRRALGCVDDLQEAHLTLAAEQMRQEGAPSNRWRWSLYHSAWVMPYATEDLPAKYRYPWSDTCRDHDPICIVSRLGSEWRLRWRDMTKPTTVHQTARDAMQTAESR